MKRFSLTLAVLALLASACSTATREDAIAELVDAGFTQETSECMMDDMAASGIEPADLTGDLEPEVEVAIELAVNNCLTGADVSGIMTEEEARQAFIDGVIEAGLTEEQASCVFDNMLGNGAVSMDDVIALGGGEPMTAEMETALQAAIAACP